MRSSFVFVVFVAFTTFATGAVVACGSSAKPPAKVARKPKAPPPPFEPPALTSLPDRGELTLALLDKPAPLASMCPPPKKQRGPVAIACACLAEGEPSSSESIADDPASCAAADPGAPAPITGARLLLRQELDERSGSEAEPTVPTMTIELLLQTRKGASALLLDDIGLVPAMGYLTTYTLTSRTFAQSQGGTTSLLAMLERMSVDADESGARVERGAGLLVVCSLADAAKLRCAELSLGERRAAGEYQLRPVVDGDGLYLVPEVANLPEPLAKLVGKYALPR